MTDEGRDSQGLSPGARPLCFSGRRFSEGASARLAEDVPVDPLDECLDVKRNRINEGQGRLDFPEKEQQLRASEQDRVGARALGEA